MVKVIMISWSEVCVMKALKAILKTLVVLAVLGGLGYGGWRLYQSRVETQSQAATVSYVPVTIGTGTLTKSVTGTGSLSINTTEDVTTDFPVTLTKVLVRAGESVTEGQAIAEVDTDALKASIIAINEEVISLDSSIASLTNSYKETSTLKSSVAGRVKAIYGKTGDMTSTVMAEYGGLMLISTDGKMRVTVNTTRLSLDDTVTVTADGKDYTGTVESVDGSKAVITFTDTTVLPGTKCEVTYNGKRLATPKAEVNMPAIVTTTTDGCISKIYVKVNGAVYKNTQLIYLTHIPADTDYDDYMQQRDAKVAALAQARQVLISGEISATVSGIVESTVSRGSYEAGESLATVYVGDAKQMVISVDELDIIHVEVGQAVSIAMDAVTDKTYDGTVSYISQIGTASSGVTNYSVTLDVDGDETLKIGMNGTATIVVENVDNAVLVPLTALSYGRGGSYVWLYDAESEEGRRQVYVETGLSGADYAEVKSGLKAGDIVLVTRTAAGSSSSGSSSTQGFDFSQFSLGGGSGMPSMPSGGSGGSGFTRPSGGGSSRPSGSGSDSGSGRPSGN